MSLKFSVLMSLYIREKPRYLDECFDSLSKQTVLADEIVIVFDGPVTKQLEDVVDKWSAELPVHVKKLNENHGLGRALQIGLDVCRNDLIARMDTDDICTVDRFEKQLSQLEKNKYLGCVGSYIHEFDINPNESSSIRNVPISHSEILQFSKFRNPMNHMTVMFRKSAVLEAGGYLDLPLMEDYYLWLRMLRSGTRFANISECLVNARVGNGMLERRGGLEYAISEMKLAGIKRKLQLANFLEAYSIACIRAGSRVFGAGLRKMIYRFLRK